MINANPGRIWPMLAFACAMAAPSANATLPIQHWQTSGGARVLFVETHELPMLDVAVDFPAGASRDTAEKSGAASLTLGLMRSGAATFDEEEISRRLANVGVGSSRVDLQACKLEYSIVSPK